MAKPAPIASSLADSMARQIAEGAFKPGDKLPSLRARATLHGYAKNTVVAAFELLVARDLVEPRRGSGYFVKATSRAPGAATDDTAG